MPKWMLIERTIPEKTVKTILGEKHFPERTVQEWHTEKCLADHRQWEIEKELFEIQYPGYCRKCNGWGGHWYSFDPSPAGISLGPGSMQDFAVCECIEGGEWWEGRCPRCGAPYWKTVPTSFIREQIAEMRQTWVKWQEKWGQQDTMEDVLGEWSAEHMDQCLACGWNSDNLQGLRPEPECYCYERSDYPEKVSA
jgi:hypothetical protein